VYAPPPIGVLGVTELVPEPPLPPPNHEAKRRTKPAVRAAKAMKMKTSSLIRVSEK
jgi:hypothetical protein